SPDTARRRAPLSPSRRGVMRTAGLAGTVAVIGSSAAVTSACSSGEEESAPTEDANPPATAVPGGSGTVIEDTYGVTQRKEGEFCAFSSVCTHQACQFKTVTEPAILCPCPSSNFAATTGEVLAGPAEEPLSPYEVTEADWTLTIKGK